MVCRDCEQQSAWNQTRPVSLLEGVSHVTQVLAYFLNTKIRGKRYAETMNR